MVRIRLRRTGLKHQSTYRIMAAEKESPRDGRFLEILGSYNPRTNPSTVEINEERVYDWMSKGAQPSNSVVQIFNSVGLMDRFARYKAGESKEALLLEAKAAYEKHAAGTKTEKPAAVSKKAAAKKEAKEAAPVKAEPKAEAPAKKEAAPETPAAEVVEPVSAVAETVEPAVPAVETAESAVPVAEVVEPVPPAAEVAEPVVPEAEVVEPAAAEEKTE